MKQLIDELVEKCGSLRKASEVTGIPHQNLSNWRKGTQDPFLEAIEKIQQVLGVPDSKVWPKVKRGKK